MPLHDITQPIGLTDEASLVDRWADYVARVQAIAPEVHAEAVELLKHAFYAGASSAFGLLTTPTPITPDDALGRARRLRAELRAFTASRGPQ